MLTSRLKGAAPVNPQVSFSFVASNAVDADTISYPTGTQIGDLLIFFDGAVAFTDTFQYPSGWNPIADSVFIYTGTLQVAIACSWLKATSTTGTVKGDFTYATSSGARRKIIAAFRPSASFSSISLFDIDSVMSNSSLSTQTITSDSGSPPLLCIAHARRFGNGSSAWPVNMTAIAGSNLGHRAGYDIQNSSPSNISVESFGYSSNYSGLQSFYLTAT